MNRISFEVPVKTASTSNLREHWATKHKRTDAQKAATRRRCPQWTAAPMLYVRLTRVAPRALDDDNLRGALKSVRDAIASWLRVDDRSPLVGWLYEQQRGPTPLVRVEIDARPLGVESELGTRMTPFQQRQADAYFEAAKARELRPAPGLVMPPPAVQRQIEESQRTASVQLAGYRVTPAYQKAQTEAVVPKRKMLAVKCECGHARGDHTSGRGVCMDGPCECVQFMPEETRS